MYLDRKSLTNSVGPDQMPQSAASDQGLHCLSLIQQFYTHYTNLHTFAGSKIDLKYKVKSKGVNI